MANDYVAQRLEGIRAVLMGIHQASAPLSANSMGHERQAFLESFLGNVLPDCIGSAPAMRRTRQAIAVANSTW